MLTPFNWIALFRFIFFEKYNKGGMLLVYKCPEVWDRKNTFPLLSVLWY